MISNRLRNLGRFRGYLIRPATARIQMAVIVAATGSTGFLSSVVLLQLGVYTIWLRYGLSVGFAYLAFLLFVRIWLVYHRRRAASNSGPSDLLDIGNPFKGNGSGKTPEFTGGGGQFGGAGASGSFENSYLFKPEPLILNKPISKSTRMFGIDLDLDELLVLVALITGLAAVLASSVYIISVAPELLSEILLDGALSAGLYRRLHHLDNRNWLESAIRKTWIPFFIVLVFFIIAGYCMHSCAPEAKSLGGVWQHIILNDQ